MKNYVIVTDSTADLPDNIIEEYNLTVIPLSYSFENEADNHDKQLGIKEFYERIKNGERATTTLINSKTFENCFASLIEEGNDILRQIQIQDRNIDVAMYRLVKYINEEEILNSKQILITVTGNAIKHGVLEQTTGYLSEEGISVKFNNAGYESSLY